MCNPSLLKVDGFVKVPLLSQGQAPAALRLIPPLDKLGAGLFPVTVSLSNRARLASGVFYRSRPGTTAIDIFYENIKVVP